MAEPPGRVLLQWKTTLRSALFVPLIMLAFALYMLVVSSIAWIIVIILDVIFLFVVLLLKIKYTITDQGIKTGRVFRPWDKFDSYSVENEKSMRLDKDGRRVFRLRVTDMNSVERVVSRFLRKATVIGK